MRNQLSESKLKDLEKIVSNSKDRFKLWINFCNYNQIKNFAELGVYRGEFAQEILNGCSSIENYYMIDSWKNLKDWNKPANTSDQEFERFLQETLSRTEKFQNVRTILRGKTTEVIEKIPDNSLDLMYIDGDHTLKGITIDLINSWSKIKSHGFITGDDFCSNIWQHNKMFEPTLVFPFAVYFAEAMDVKIFSLPFNQFLIAKDQKGYEFIELSKGDYKNKNILDQLRKFTDEKGSKMNLFKSFFKDR